MFKWINSKRNLFLQLLLLEFDWFNCSKSKRIWSKNQRRDPKLGNLSHHWAIGDFPIHGTYCWVMFFFSNPLFKKVTWKGMIFLILKSWFLFIFCSTLKFWPCKSHQSPNKTETAVVEVNMIGALFCFGGFSRVDCLEILWKKKTTPDPISRKFIFHEVYEDLRTSRILLFISIHSIMSCFFSHTERTHACKIVHLLGHESTSHQQKPYFYHCWRTKSVKQVENGVVHLVPFKVLLPVHPFAAGIPEFFAHIITRVFHLKIDRFTIQI